MLLYHFLASALCIHVMLDEVQYLLQAVFINTKGVKWPKPSLIKFSPPVKKSPQTKFPLSPFPWASSFIVSNFWGVHSWILVLLPSKRTTLIDILEIDDRWMNLNKITVFMGQFQFSKIEVLHCGKLCKFATRAYSSHLRHGAFLVGTFVKKGAFCFLTLPKQMSLLIISNKNFFFKTWGSRLCAIVTPTIQKQMFNLHYRNQ